MGAEVIEVSSTRGGVVRGDLLGIARGPLYGGTSVDVPLTARCRSITDTRQLRGPHWRGKAVGGLRVPLPTVFRKSCPDLSLRTLCRCCSVCLASGPSALESVSGTMRDALFFGARGLKNRRSCTAAVACTGASCVRRVLVRGARKRSYSPL